MVGLDFLWQNISVIKDISKYEISFLGLLPSESSKGDSEKVNSIIFTSWPHIKS